MIQVKTFYAHNDLRNFSYLIFDDETGESWVIDPYEAGPIIDTIKKNHLDLRGILNTHQHFDHIRGNGELIETFKTKVKTLRNKEAVQLNQTHALETLDTPGHTMDHQVFFLTSKNEKKALFSGDTLFNAGVGNCKNGGDIGELFKTTMNLKDLPGNLLLYPGHDYIQRNLEFAATIEPENNVVKEKLREVKDEDVLNRRPRTLNEEFKVNPFFRLDSGEIREKFKSDLNSVEDESLIRRDLFTKLRSLRDRW